jgi:hypothetical protein
MLNVDNMEGSAYLPEVGAILPISPRDAYTAMKPSQVARHVYKKPALPPFVRPKAAVERMASHDAMRITLKPNMEMVPKLRCGHVRYFESIKEYESASRTFISCGLPIRAISRASAALLFVLCKRVAS